MKQLALDIFQPPAPTLENFVVGRNAEALAHLRAALTGAGAGERFIYLWGEAGSGRTHLLRAGAAQGKYVACTPDSTNSAFNDDAPVLAADNVEQLNATAQEALFHRYNRLRESGGVLLASGPLPPRRLALRADLLTRLAWGLVIELHALADNEKAQALQHHAHARGLKLTDDVTQYLLAHAPRGMGELYAVFDELDQRSLQTHRAITVPLVREVLSASVNQQKII